MSGSKNWYIYTMDNYAAERKEFLPFCDSMVGSGDYYAKSKSQLVKDKYHMISLIRKI